LDLEVDVVKSENEIKVIDIDDLEKVKNIVGEYLYEKIFEVIEEVKKII